MLELQERESVLCRDDLRGMAAAAGRSYRPTEAPVFQERLRRSVELEAQLRRRLIRCVVFAIPVFVAIWVGLVALAVAVSASGTELAGPLAMAAAIGVLSALFFGPWAAIVSLTEQFETVDEDDGQAPALAAADRPGPPRGRRSVAEPWEPVR